MYNQRDFGVYAFCFIYGLNNAKISNETLNVKLDKRLHRSSVITRRHHLTAPHGYSA